MHPLRLDLPHAEISGEGRRGQEVRPGTGAGTVQMKGSPPPPRRRIRAVTCTPAGPAPPEASPPGSSRCDLLRTRRDLEEVTTV